MSARAVPPSTALLARFAPLAPAAWQREVLLHQAPDLFALWHEWEAESADRCEPPFWAVVWPAAALLAELIASGAIDVRDRTVLDLGCGGGAVAVTVARAGAARVIANDVDPVALAIAGRNAEANGVAIERDDRDHARADRLPEADLILVADLFYEREPARALLARLERARASGATVLCADGGRPFFPASGARLLAERRVPVDPAVETASERRVRVMALA